MGWSITEKFFFWVADDKTKGMVKGSKIGSAPRKRLADISNLQQRPRPVDHEVKQLPVSLTTKEYTEKLQRVCSKWFLIIFTTCV